jgi:hypothetical protein
MIYMIIRIHEIFTQLPDKTERKYSVFHTPLFFVWKSRKM